MIDGLMGFIGIYIKYASIKYSLYLMVIAIKPINPSSPPMRITGDQHN